jgi:hypothetical protein
MKSFKELTQKIHTEDDEPKAAWKIAFDVFSEQDERYKGFFVVFEGSQSDAIENGMKVLSEMYPNNRHEVTVSRVKEL